ncbi:Transforming growth factor-beta-induced protein ig-h3 [Nymphon striatum]|nr:Transforming growth factor-beta-induced protein ig-h3 [Nymphon striatum]
MYKENYLYVTSCYDQLKTDWIHGSNQQTQDKNIKVPNIKVGPGPSGLFRPIPPNPLVVSGTKPDIQKPQNPDKNINVPIVNNVPGGSGLFRPIPPDPFGASGIKPDFQKPQTPDENPEPNKPEIGPGGSIPRPIPPNPAGKLILKSVDLSKLFPPSVEKVQKSITQIFIDNKWKDFAAKPIPNRRPIYPPVYESPTDIPPNPFNTEPTLKPTPYKPQYTEPSKGPTPKPYHTKEITQRPHYTGPTTQRPHYTGPTTQRPLYTGPTTQRPHYTGPTTQRPHYTGPTTQRPHYTGPTTQRPHYTGPTTQRPHYTGPTTQRPPYTGPTIKSPLTGIDTFIPVSNPNLHQIVQSLTLNRFIHVIDEAGLSDYLTGNGPVTLFVPSNEAFERLPLDVLKQMIEDKEFLKKVLEYHIVSGASHYIGNLDHSYLQLTSISGQKININSHRQVISANGILVLKPDLPASNGVFHIINDVLYPPVKNTIWEILQDEKFSTFVHIIKSSEKVINYFKNGGPYTLFAPSNLAFNKLDSTTLKWIKENPGIFAETVLSLVTKGMYYSYHLHDGNSLASLIPGNSLDIGVSGSMYN